MLEGGATRVLDDAGRLWVLAIAPRGMSPDPDASTEGLFVMIAISMVVIAPIVAVAAARRLEVLEARVAAGLWILASVAFSLAAAGSRAKGETLLSSYYATAPFAWGALAGTAATLAGRFLGVSFKNRRMAGAILTLLIGIFLFRDASAYVASPLQQWRAVLAESPASDGALSALEPELVKSGEIGAASRKCLASEPASCRCNAISAELKLRSGHSAEAGSEAAAAMKCPELAMRARPVRAVVLAIDGDLEAADREIEAARAHAAEDPTVAWAAALVASKRGDLSGALAFGRKAAEGGAGRDAELLVAATLLLQKDLPGAREALVKMVKAHPNDARILYNLALVDDLEDHYNPAREGYLKALKQEPGLADARYNLAVLTLNAGFVDEARHHARKFIETFPDDPRAPALLARTQLPR